MEIFRGVLIRLMGVVCIVSAVVNICTPGHDPWKTVILCALACLLFAVKVGD
jgi:hypothetical protein